MFSRTRPSWYKPDIGLATRMFLVMAILVGVYVFFGFFLFEFVRVNLVVLIVFAAIIAGAQLFFADKIALLSMGARVVSEQEEPELHDIIGRLAMQANLPKPRIAIVNTSIPNAFATGRDKNHAVVAVTTALKQQLPPQELEAVLAHELTHIINRDMLVMTIATFFTMVAGLLTRSLLWSGMMGGYGGGYGRRNNNNDGGGVIIITLLVSAIVAAISFVLVRTLSRYRELAADRGSALITGSPEHLASALLRISGKMDNPNSGIPQADFRQAKSVNALFIVPAIRGESLSSLFSTHPSTEERVKRLQAMAEQMERGPH
ncbi:MAG: zinc metalloprotease HtpX [Ktedonobacterales bacterium]